MIIQLPDDLSPELKSSILQTIAESYMSNNTENVEAAIDYKHLDSPATPQHSVIYNVDNATQSANPCETLIVSPAKEFEISTTTEEAEKQETDTEENTAQADQRVDEKGVAFDPKFCAVAKDPFYGTGPRKGQWKKRKGVSDHEYSEWYMAREHQAVVESHNVAKAAFMATAGDPKESVAAEPAQTSEGPRTLGELMAWVAEKQTTSQLTTHDVASAYVKTGVDYRQLANPETAEQSVKTLWNHLNGLL